MFEAVSIRRYIAILFSFSHLLFGFLGSSPLTPLLGVTPHLTTASITLPFSSSTSLVQSVFPVATTRCVAHPFTCPYSSSSSSILHFAGYRMVQLSQSCSQSSPSTDGSTLGNRVPLGAVVKVPSGCCFASDCEAVDCRKAVLRRKRDESWADIFCYGSGASLRVEFRGFFVRSADASLAESFRPRKRSRTYGLHQQSTTITLTMSVPEDA